MHDTHSSKLMREARETLTGRSLGKDDQEALLVIAALIANYRYDPHEIHPESIHSSWYERIEDIWRTPPGFRYRVFEHIIHAAYGHSEYGRDCHEAMREALDVFLPREHPAQEA
jgi:hypothetical protein